MRICSFCFKEALNAPIDTKKFPIVFCGPEHYDAYRTEQAKGNKAETPCSWCNKPVTRFKWMIKQGRRFYCSNECEGNWKSKNKTGDKVYNFKGTGDRWSNYGASWPYAKRQVLERDNHQCQECGKIKVEIGKEPDVHHLIPFDFFGLDYHEIANELSNLICLCPSCHTKRDAKIAFHIRAIGVETVRENIRLFSYLKAKSKTLEKNEIQKDNIEIAI